jgi:hypothetical protein
LNLFPSVLQTSSLHRLMYIFCYHCSILWCKQYTHCLTVKPLWVVMCNIISIWCCTVKANAVDVGALVKNKSQYGHEVSQTSHVVCVSYLTQLFPLFYKCWYRGPDSALTTQLLICSVHSCLLSGNTVRPVAIHKQILLLYT